MRSQSLCNILSDEKMGLSLINMLGLSSSVRITHTQHVTENFSFCTTYKLSVSTGSAKHVMSILHILCYNSSLVTWTVVSLITAKFKPIIFSVSGFALSCASNKFILMIIYIGPHWKQSLQHFLIFVFLVFVAAEVCLPSRCVASGVFSGSTILTFSRHVPYSVEWLDG
jgi:hypothetical protein